MGFFSSFFWGGGTLTISDLVEFIYSDNLDKLLTADYIKKNVVFFPLVSLLVSGCI